MKRVVAGGPGGAPSVPPATILVALAVLLLALPSGGFSPLAVGVATLVVWIAAILIVLAAAASRIELELSPLLIWAGAAIAALAALTAISLGREVDDAVAFTDVVRLLGYLAVLVLVGVLAGRGDARRWLAGLALGIVAVAVVAIGARLLGTGGDVELSADLPSAAGRLSFPLGYWNALGSLLAAAVPLLGWLAATARGRGAAGACIAGLAPVLTGILMTSSRGSIIAAGIGAVLLVAVFAAGRRAAAGALVSGFLFAVPALVAALVSPGFLDSAPAGIGGSELTVGAALIAGIAGATLLGRRVAKAIGGLGIWRLDPRLALGAVLVVAAVVIAILGPGRLVGDFGSGGNAAREGAGIASTSGTGRSQLWSTALDAFADEPGAGIGAGGFSSFWNRNGSLDTPALNAHSEPLELLAELGIGGFAAFVGLVAIVIVAGFRRLGKRGDRSGEAAAALAVFTTSLIGFSIDWTWDVPAAALPALVAAGLLCGRSMRRDAADGRNAGSSRSDLGPVRGLVLIGLGVVGIWSAGVLSISSDRLDASDEALAEGKLGDAAAAARSAAALQPWSAAPWLQLGAVEQAAGNLSAARRAVQMAIERTPGSFEPWLLAAELERQLGDADVAAAYMERARRLAPLVLERAIRSEPAVGAGAP